MPQPRTGWAGLGVDDTGIFSLTVYAVHRLRRAIKIASLTNGRHCLRNSINCRAGMLHSSTTGVRRIMLYS
nr:hypothetical protein [Pseudomonas syringae pv. actinidiae]